MRTRARTATGLATAIQVAVVVSMAGIAAIAGCSTAVTSSPPAATKSPGRSASTPGQSVSARTHWLIGTSGITKLEQLAGSAAVARYFDGPQTTVITPSTIPSSLASWHVIFALDTRSLAEVRSGVNGLSPRISAILYDPEAWSFTPVAEQSNVGAATAQAASMAHAAGRKLIVTPATDLTKRGMFIQSDDLAKVAASADVVEIQAQGMERDPATYAAFVGRAVSQIRSANPGVMIYAGLSTNPAGAPVTVTELLLDVRLTSFELSGYWLNIPSQSRFCPTCGQAQPQIALRLLASMAR